MTSTSRTPVARLSSPGAIVSTIPSLCGFEPHDSLVVLSLRGERRRLGLTARLDLPAAAHEAEAADLLADRIAHDGARAAAVAVFATDRRDDLVDEIEAALEAHGVEVAEALHVDRGLWWSYRCRLSCCPEEGTAVPPPPTLVQAQRALDGRAVLASREELVASLAPPTFLAAKQCAQRLDDATVRFAESWLERPDDTRGQALGEARRLLDAVAQGHPVPPEEAASLAVAVHDVQVRDAVATWSLKRSDALLSLLEQVARQTVTPYDAPVCALLAWVAYARGDGSRANVALDRALDTDPGYSLALLLRTGLDGAVPPREIRKVLKATRRALSSPG